MSTPVWRKSTRSGSSGGDCVETAKPGVTVMIRDSKLGDASPVLRVDDWRGFLASVTK